MRRCLTIAALFLAMVAVVPVLRAAGASAALQEAMTALQRQDYNSAEQKLRAELKLHPADAETLSLLGVALDGQKRFQEANQVHQRAVASNPRLPAVLNNLANNQLATGDEKGARETFLKTLALDPEEHYANLQLAQMAINRKDGSTALGYLNHLRNAPEAALMRLIALDLTGNRAEADSFFNQLASTTQNDAKLSAADGWELAKAGQFDQAEVFLTHALAADPSNFQLMYGVGVTASQAGHNDRAREVLETALRQQPKNVDALYALAFVYSALRQPEPTIRLLAEAAQLSPQRADVQRLLAVTTGDIKAHEDSVAAWERYMKLAPNDDTGRRERGFEKAHLGLFSEAIADLEWFVTRHPDDAVGFYELGVAESADDPTKGISSLDRAIQLKADFVAARSARGGLEYLQGQPEAALPDLEFVVKQPSVQPAARAAMLDRLGQAYLALDRLKDAVPVLRKAAELAPDDAATQLHLANALAEAGQTEESDALMARFRQLRPGGNAAPVRGVVDYLSLTLEQRHDDYKARLEKTVKEHPDDSKAQLLYLKLLLSDDQIAEAIADAQRFAALKPDAAALGEAGRALLEAKLYAPAQQLLQQAGVQPDLAVAGFRAAGSGTAAADEGLRQLDRVTPAGRNGDYYLARAQMLDAAGKPDDAMAAMDQALKLAPGRADFYWQAAVLMTRNHRADDALRMLDEAAQALPRDAQIPAIRGAMLELAGKTEEALRVLNEAQHRWPEAAAIWVARGMILFEHEQQQEARRAFATAVALGAHSREHVVSSETLFLTKPPRDW